MWKGDRAQVERAAAELFDRLRLVTSSRGAGQPAVAGDESLDVAIEQFQMAFDTRHGGFGDAPKFPVRPSCCSAARACPALGGRRGAQAPLLMATGKLRAMGLGRDARFTSAAGSIAIRSRRVRVPHFEKMLVRPGAAHMAYLERWSGLGRGVLPGRLTDDTLHYVLRDMTARRRFLFRGGRGQRADGHAGDAARTDRRRVLVWTEPTGGGALAATMSMWFRRGVGSKRGKRPHDPHGGSPAGTSVCRGESVHDIAIPGRGEDDVRAALARARAAMFDARARRARPHLGRQGPDGLERPMSAALRAAPACSPAGSRRTTTAARHSAPQAYPIDAVGTADASTAATLRDGNAGSLPTRRTMPF